MIASLRGTLTQKSPTEAVLDVHGVGYALSIPVSTFERLGPLNTEVFLYTHQHVREDTLQLFGFATEEERTMFRLLLTVTGIGPKMAQGVLSAVPVSELRMHLAGGNLAALTAIPGIGKKLAERLVLELREKTGKIAPLSPGSPTDERSRVHQEALLALLSLGYARPAAERALRAALGDADGAPTVETLLKAALRHAGR